MNRLHTDLSVYLFDDMEDAARFETLERPGRSSPEGLWEFDAIPVVVTESSWSPGSERSFHTFRRHYPIAYLALLKGLDRLLSWDVDLISLSVGPAEADDQVRKDDPLIFGVRQCLAKGVPCIAAAGNSGPALDTMQTLAKIPGVISVGAVGPDGDLLAHSSRGPQGGFGPTVVSYGNPQMVYLREGWEPPGPATSFAAPRVGRVALVVLKAMQILWTNYQRAATQELTGETAPLRLARIGFVDTGIAPGAGHEMPKRVEELLAKEEELFTLPVDAHQRDWLTEVHEAVGDLPMTGVTLHSLQHALETLAKPLRAYQRHEVGAGLVSKRQCRRFLGSFTPSRFLRLFCPGGEERSDLRVELGPLWDEDYVGLMFEFFYDGCQTYMAKVV